MTRIEQQYMDAVIALNRRQREQENAGIDWEQRRWDAAVSVLSAICSDNPQYVKINKLADEHGITPLEMMASVAIDIADSLVTEYKKKTE